MKLISCKENRHMDRLVSEDAVFDPSLATLSAVDKDSALIALEYDALENGFPLDLPIEPSETSLIVKLTPTGIHTSILISELGDSPRAAYLFEEYGDELGGIRFNVRLTEWEQLMLMHRIAHLLVTQ